jgi:adenosylcobinamide kinase/adenosylcobinamide-phosphate guanylyltransferase
MDPAAPRPRLPRLTLVLGGARSGKSRHAEGLVTAAPSPWIYVATAQAFDDEMAVRIAEHRSRRDAGWTTIEAPLDLAGAIAAHANSSHIMLIDCLTLWLSNVMLDNRDVEAACDMLVDALAAADGPIVVVSNEVGLGIVPDNALARRFRDAQGRLNQQVAANADRVVLMAAGLPLTLK